MGEPRRRTTIFLAMACAIAVLLTASVLMTVRCIVVSVNEGRIVYVTSVSDGDSVIISHNNSIYDAPVEEHLEVRGDLLTIVKVVTGSQGIREYYGIADTVPGGKWPMIRVFSTGERNFSLTIRGVPVSAFKEQKDAHFLIEMKKAPFYRLVFWKLHLFI